MKIKISKMSIEDLEQIANNLTTDFDDFWNYNILKQDFLNESNIYIIAKNQEKDIVGFAGLQFILDEANITNIVTKKKYRNNGIGSLLLENLISISKEKNMSCITLEVNEHNIFALRLYNKYGFKTVGSRKKYYNGTDCAFIMTLELRN